MTTTAQHKLYIGLALFTTMIVMVGLVIWQQFGNPMANTAARDSQSDQTGLKQGSTLTQEQNIDMSVPEIIGYSGEDGQTALALLKGVYPSTVTSGDGVNQVVVSIGGRPRAGEALIWNFYLNGELAQVSPNGYETSSQDKIEWRLEQF